MNLPAGLTTRFGSQILTLKQNAPQLLFAGGITAGVTSTVLACKATLQLETKLEGMKVNLDEVRVVTEIVKADPQDPRIIEAFPDGYSLSDAKRDTAIIYTRSIIDLIRLYAPAIGAGLLSVALLTKSQHILHERNAGLAAAYAAVNQAFNNYRERVVADHGVEKDQEYLYGSEEVEIINPETGRKKKVLRAEGPSMYAKLFDETNRNFQRDPDYNLMFLTGVQNYMNDKLQATGHLFLNDVYDALGMSRTKAGAVVGWLKGEGDNFVDFGIYEGKTETARDFIQGKEGAILLDFNVLGLMWDRIDESGDTDWLQTND